MESIQSESIIKFNKYCEKTLNSNRLTLASGDAYVTFDTGIRLDVIGTLCSKQSDVTLQHGYINVRVDANDNQWQQELGKRKETILERIENAVTTLQLQDVAPKDSNGQVSSNTTKQYTIFKNNLKKAKDQMIQKLDKQFDDMAIFDWKDVKKSRELIKSISSFECKGENETPEMKFSFTVNNIKDADEKKRAEQFAQREKIQKGVDVDPSKFLRQSYYIYINKQLLDNQYKKEELTQEQQDSAYQRDYDECVQIINNNIQETETFDDFCESECERFYIFPASIPRDRIVNQSQLRFYDVKIAQVKLDVRLLISTSSLEIKKIYFMPEKLTLSSPKIKYTFNIKNKTKRIPGLAAGTKSLKGRINTSNNTSEQKVSNQPRQSESENESDIEDQAPPKKSIKVNKSDKLEKIEKSKKKIRKTDDEEEEDVDVEQDSMSDEDEEAPAQNIKKNKK